MTTSPQALAWLRGRLSSGRSLVIGTPFAFLLVFFMIPFAAVLMISFADPQMSIPPYTPIVEFREGALRITMTLEHYRAVLTDPLYVGSYLYSIGVAAVTTVLCLLIGYPACYLIARSSPSRRNLLLMAVILPFWTSY